MNKHSDLTKIEDAVKKIVIGGITAPARRLQRPLNEISRTACQISEDTGYALPPDLVHLTLHHMLEEGMVERIVPARDRMENEDDAVRWRLIGETTGAEKD